MNTIQTRIRNKRDTSANWEQNNPVLLSGEIIIVDTNSGERRTKTGDGIKRYNELPFDDELIRNLVSSKDAETLASAKTYTDDKVGDIDLSNMVVATGGGSIQPDGSIGSGPFVITMDEDNDAELSASVVGYSNSSSGLTSNNVQSAIDEVSENVNGKIAKVSGASTGHLPTFSSDGQIADSGKSITDIAGVPVVEISSDDGVNYTGFSDQISELVTGTAIIAVPNKTSTASECKLSINGSELLYCRMKRWGASVGQYPYYPNWMPAGEPVILIYELSDSGIASWKIIGVFRMDFASVSGTVRINQGGTGITSLTGTDYNTSRVRGIALLTTTPSSIPNGCLVGVYE